MNTHTIETSEEMEKWGLALGKACLHDDKSFILFLTGDLGAGKTTLVRGFLRGFNYQGAVKSPTYTLVEPYELMGYQIYHFDLYRLNFPEELEFIGIRDYFENKAFCLIEWPEKAQGVLPQADLAIHFQIEDMSRTLTLKAVSQRGQDVLQALQI